MKLYILGGRPCSGKTTLSYHLGEKHNIKVLYLDVFAQKYVQKSTPNTPNLYRWKDKDLVDVLQKPPQLLFEEYLGFYEEMLPLLLNDLDSMEEKEVILEGSFFLPTFIAILKKHHDIEVCYMVTDDEFVREKYIQRNYVQDMITKPLGKVALENLLNRDCIFAKYIYDEVQKYSLSKMNLASGKELDKQLINLENILNLKS